MKYPKFLTENGGIPVGAADDFPAGSVERAKLRTLGVLTAWELVSATDYEWNREIGKAKRESSHKQLGFDDFDAYILALTGKTEEQAAQSKAKLIAADPEVKPLNSNGGDRRSERAKVNQSSITTLKPDRGAAYLVRRLKRDAPEIAEALGRGEYPSARAAGIAAGIVKVPTPLEAIKKLISKLSPAERRALLRLLKEPR